MVCYCCNEEDDNLLKPPTSTTTTTGDYDGGVISPMIDKKLIAQGLDPETHNLLSPNKNKLKSSNNIAIKNKKFYPEDTHEVFTIETSRTSMNFASIVEMKESPPTHFQEFVPLSQFEHNQENHPNPAMLIDELQHCSCEFGATINVCHEISKSSGFPKF
ncbi:hypothetical protein LIER_44056 [Lithospermum erythrorhizon]|uniref:Uncharacterized protein n=1 Tax=Lithospermum erythrorhizon TaxID=34254 RepID=A0AAV3NST7_LITER